ncbi:MAG: glycoside hydrolase family 43 protein, partial [Sphingomicrobium sp.]
MADSQITTVPVSFAVDPQAEGDGFRICVSADGHDRTYMVPTATQQDFSIFFRELAKDFGTRTPHVFADPIGHPPASFPWRPLLTENVHPQILVGYGDPAVLQDGEDYWLVSTSNDAPDAFPILHSVDLAHWEPRGFVFPAGREPEWTAKGRNMADFWAPEMAKVDGEYWTVFTARQANNALAIGLARAASPLGPWTDNGAPLIIGKPVNTTGLGYDSSQPQMSGGVIDPHLLIDPCGDKHLFWKDDTNSIWPRPLAMLLRHHPELLDRLFRSDADRRTAAFAAAIVPWANVQRPMVRFFVMQPLIEAALANWAEVRKALIDFGLAPAILEAMTTPIRAQRI